MNRFEKRSALSQHLKKIPLSLVVIVVVFLLFFRGLATVSGNTLDKQEDALNRALNRSIIQCYAVEGTYPPSLDYLKEHYGLIYDEELFFVDYTAIGSNIRPDVTVIRRTK
ncbi:MAG: hypothetical protein K5682_05285 [Lachnospiraceae bacterium]|nr:hypothetical protein [Lachnospiraceae bacterium]